MTRNVGTYIWPTTKGSALLHWLYLAQGKDQTPSNRYVVLYHNIGTVIGIDTDKLKA